MVGFNPNIITQPGFQGEEKKLENDFMKESFLKTVEEVRLAGNVEKAIELFSLTPQESSLPAFQRGIENDTELKIYINKVLNNESLTSLEEKRLLLANKTYNKIFSKS